MHKTTMFKFVGVFALIAMGLFVGKGLIASPAHAQTGAPHYSVSIAPDFENDIQQGKQEVAGDSAALSDQQEISGGDEESAGDAHGDQMEADGENSQDQINSEIEQDAEQEDASSEEHARGDAANDASSSSSSEGN